MNHYVDRLDAHDHIVSEDIAPTHSGLHAAQRIESAIALEGWPIGRVIGSEEMLRLQFGLGHRVVREAIRILQSRRAVHSLRGSKGGLVVGMPSRSITVGAIADYLEAIAVEDRELEEARSHLERVVTRRALRVDDNYAAGAGTSKNIPVAALFSEAVAEVRVRRTRQVPLELVAPSLCPDHKSRSAMIANELLSQINGQRRSGQPESLGTEQELCERYGVSQVVVRQALRILEAHGMAQTRRGRGGGTLTCAPQVRGAVEPVLTYLSASGVRLEALLDWSRSVSEMVTELAVARWCDKQDAVLESSLRESAQHFSPRAGMRLLQLELEACQNRVLALIARCLAAYHVRFMPDIDYSTDAEMHVYRESLVTRTLAVSRRDPKAAQRALCHSDRVLVHMYRRFPLGMQRRQQIVLV